MYVSLDNDPVDGRPPVVRTQGLTKSYGPNRVVDRLDLELPAGSLVGLLGPNGSGKSTLLKLLVGLIAPDTGKIEIAGYDLATEEMHARRQIAYVPDVPNLYPELTVYEHLELIARAHNTLDTLEGDARTVLEMFGLWEARHYPTFALSRGMTQKLAICDAFVRPSSVLLMDEPTGSLDIASVDELYSLLREYRQHGGTALLSSHQWEALDDVCDTYVILGPRNVHVGDLSYLREAARLRSNTSLRDVYLALTRGNVGR